MKKKPEQNQENRPFFIEVPKPVNKMTKVERDAFVAEILEAIDGQRNWKAAHYVNLKPAYEKTLMGFQLDQLMRRSMQQPPTT